MNGPAMFESPAPQEVIQHPKALERARHILERDRIDPNSFRDLYDNSQIDSDNAFVAERQQRIDAECFRSQEHRIMKEMADIFEVIMYQVAEQADWFGRNATISLPSLYDDYRNHVDSLIEIDQHDGISISAISLDVTFKKSIGSKLREIIDKLQQGQLTKVKYYESEKASFRGEKTGVPHFVVGVSFDTLSELTNLFAEGKNSLLAGHQVQFQILDEIILQAECFAEIGKKNGNTNVEDAYGRVARIFRGIYEERSKVITDKGTRDHFFERLQDDLRGIELERF